jgi:hypothetical protein
VVAALARVQAANRGLEISITLGTGQAGPEAAGRSLIADAAAIGFQPTVWTLMRGRRRMQRVSQAPYAYTEVIARFRSGQERARASRVAPRAHGPSPPAS